jgi:biopolymer transport protein TolR
MAFSTNSSGSGYRRRSRASQGSLSEINVVPLVDVVLVLLIIFMLTAQAMQFGLEIELPKVSTEKASAQELPVINVTKTGELYINDEPVNFNEMVAKLRAKFGKRADIVYLRADKQGLYDPVVQVVSVLTDAKINVRLVTQTDDSRPRRR